MVVQGFWDCAVKSYKAEGTKVFTRGFSMVILRALPTNGSIFLVYESTNEHLRKLLRESDQANCDNV